MARTEQRTALELDKLRTTACKELGKKRGWKTIAGQQYQVQDGILYTLYIFPDFFDCAALKVSLACKPVALDEIYWDVFHMKETAEKQPFSFHVHGAFTARNLNLSDWKAEFPAPEEPLPALEKIFDQAEAVVEENRFPDIAAFRRRLEAEASPHSALNMILCLLLEEKYPEAMEAIQAALAKGDNGSFSRENGRRSIMEDARDWCAARL